MKCLKCNVVLNHTEKHKRVCELCDAADKVTLKPILDRRVWPGRGIEVNRGWHELLMKCHEECVKVDPEYSFYMAKEKYGILRFEARSEKGSLFDITGHYENLSRSICEDCGSDADQCSIDGWYRTLCDDCYEAICEDGKLKKVPQYREAISED